MHTITSHKKILNISTPVVMGILNATPDSFYNKGQDNDIESLLKHAEKMLNDGATILDIGGASSKPGQPLITTAEEMKRVLPAIIAIRKSFPDAWISVDTYNSEVARQAVAGGADIINDISAGAFDMDMLKTVAILNVPYVAMHIQGTPETMQQNPQYDNVVAEVHRHIRIAINRCTDAGIKQIIVDPGFGFGKTVEHNYELLKMLGKFASLGKPILAGISRKSMICKPLKVRPEYALNGTTALNMAALLHGANILRVHDVKEAVETVKLYTYLQ